MEALRWCCWVAQFMELLSWPHWAILRSTESHAFSAICAQCGLLKSVLGEVEVTAMPPHDRFAKGLDVPPPSAMGSRPKTFTKSYLPIWDEAF